jgi:hypothetical protein
MCGEGVVNRKRMLSVMEPPPCWSVLENVTGRVETPIPRSRNQDLHKNPITLPLLIGMK